ncbi:nucleotidyltransferase domain-containing protein [Burkholderia sp. MBR-1]|uniref:nucleotidyltransferase domain-containing protein n=1 Tax=Burkholderia sp. MBR-1 TaxID=2732364 RepID=UPI0015EF73A5|nr:nucleotidyltransferase domain-containing protein [Burkholderia sp. MBR-1]QMI49688.1 nucleotidyltransferase domain-containing protein [Burkholderia sp. MBR-1]
MGIDDNLALTALFPATLRRKLLARLFLSPGSEYHASGLARELHVHRGNLARELSELTAAGILKKVQRGSSPFYSANQDAPYFLELRGLFQKLAGAVPAIQKVVQAHAEDLKYALIFGSTARGTARPDSDIDLMLIGDGITGRMKAELRGAIDEFGKELDIQDMTVSRFNELVESDDPYINEVFNNPVVMLFGDYDELKNSSRVSGHRAA